MRTDSAFVQVIDNAAKYSPPGAAIDPSAAAKEQAESVVGHACPAAVACCFVWCTVPSGCSGGL